jgi:hypothetical protein
MPRALKAAAQRDARRGTQRGTQDYTEGTQLILRGYSGDSLGCGVHVGVPTGLHARARTPAFAELSALVRSQATAFGLAVGVNPR